MAGGRRCCDGALLGRPMSRWSCNAILPGGHRSCDGPSLGSRQHRRELRCWTGSRRPSRHGTVERCIAAQATTTGRIAAQRRRGPTTSAASQCRQHHRMLHHNTGNRRRVLRRSAGASLQRRECLRPMCCVPTWPPALHRIFFRSLGSRASRGEEREVRDEESGSRFGREAEETGGSRSRKRRR